MQTDSKGPAVDSECRSRHYKDLGPLGELLIKACPPDPHTGVKSIPVLAKALGLAPWSLYKWIQNIKIPPDRAVEVVNLSGGRVSIEDFHPYVFR